MTRREHRFLNEAKNPSFSSTLLDEIYRSIDEGDSEMKFYTEKKQSRVFKTEEYLAKANLYLPRVSKANNVVGNQGRQRMMQKERTFHQDHHVHDQDALFFSSTSSSSDSSSGLLSSSSDTESMYGVRSSRGSCFAPSRPKPVRTTVPERIRSDKKHEERHIVSNDDGLIKSKSRALKIYNNLKKVKQPISPGGKLTSFLNSLFTTGNNNSTKKTKPCFEDANAVRKTESVQASTCSSASSFARSCLSKTSPSTREKMRNGVKRTVRFYPVSVIVDEDCRPCGQKYLPADKKNRGVEEAAREFLKEYHHIERKNDLILRDFPMKTNLEDEDDDEDDAASCSSSDLFELDHLHQELPVYETTHLGTNRAIANRFIM